MAELGKIGIANSSECPKGGHVWLTSGTKQLLVPTTCKAWKCLGCRDRKKRQVLDKVEYGCRELGTCWLITLTFRLGSETPRDAASVDGAWRSFLMRLRRWSPKEADQLAWFKIVELTKRGQPHLHLVVSGITPDEEARRRVYSTGPGETRTEEDSAIAGPWSQMWEGATKDSYVVDVERVFSDRGAAGYLGKYLSKDMFYQDAKRELGFIRRFSSSRRWPHDTSGFVGTLRKVWNRVEFVGGSNATTVFKGTLRDTAELVEESLADPLLARVNSVVGGRMAALATVKRDRKKFAHFIQEATFE